MDQKSSNDFELRKIKDEIKHQMRLRSFTYDDLATHLGISTSSVKRVLGKEDLSISRLKDIADFLGMQLWELVAQAQEPRKVYDQLTLEQEEFLAENPGYYHFFTRITERRDIDWIADQNGLSDVSVETYLDELERLGLIVRIGDRRAKPLVRPIIWIKDRPLYKKFLVKSLDVMAERCRWQLRTDQPNPDMRFRSRAIRMRPETFREYMQRVEHLFEQYMEHAARESKLCDPRELVSCWFLQAMEQRCLGTDLFGPIPNIDGRSASRSRSSAAVAPDISSDGGRC